MLRLVVAAMVTVILAVAAATVVTLRAQAEAGCRVNLWPVPAVICPLDTDRIAVLVDD